MKGFGADNLKAFFMGLGMGIAPLLMLGVTNTGAMINEGEIVEFKTVFAEQFVLHDSTGNTRGGDVNN